MSMERCPCDNLIDTDDDYDCYYTNWDTERGHALCIQCRDQEEYDHIAQRLAPDQSFEDFVFEQEKIRLSPAGGGDVTPSSCRRSDSIG